MASGEARCRGAVFTSNMGYIKRKYGAQGVIQIKTQMREKGIDFDIDNIKDTEWYPGEARKAFMEALYDLFSRKDEEVVSLGKFAALHVQRLALSVMYTRETGKVVEESDRIWGKHWDQGRIVVEENAPGKTVIRLEDFDMGPLQCRYLGGYFIGVAELTGAKNVKLEETDCVSKGDPYHRYVLTWD